MLKQRLSWDCKDEVSYKRLIDCIAKHPGGCDEVWFSVVSQFPPLDIIEKNVGCPIKFVSVGAERDSLIIR